MRSAGALLSVLALTGTAAAEPPTSPITDGNYRIELYDGVVFGNAAVVGMGGAAVANAIGTAGTLFNPSAPAVKETTDTEYWSWDYHLDAIAGTSQDYDNNGFPREYQNNVMVTAGLGGRYGEWAAAITGTTRSVPNDSGVTTTSSRVQLAGARWVQRLDAAVGASLTIGELAMDDTMRTQLFHVSGALLEAGATWVPRHQSFRVGAAVASPLRGGQIDVCDPSVCASGLAPSGIVTAWRLATGFAYRFSGTDWNQLVGGYFRDEKALTLTADVVVTGPAANAYGLETFATEQHALQRSGRDHSISLRGGVEYEWKPGRLRLRAGSYWEPGRFVDVSGRLHTTLGIEVRWLQFHLWGKDRRGRFTFTVDAARQYGNAGLSIGFWH